MKVKITMALGCALLFYALRSSAMGQPSPRLAPKARVTITILRQWNQPVIKQGDPGTEGNKYGFEGGCVLKIGGKYHLFTSEMVGDPFWVKMKLAHWTSPDRLKWTRQDTMYESSGDTSSNDPRSALWAPMPVYDKKDRRWDVFYVGYRPPINLDGRIYRAVSKRSGPNGIDGPWEDVGVVLQPGADNDKWEGVQGTDSFFAFAAGRRWLGFYGSSDLSHWWRVGLAAAPNLQGPWKRLTALNPVALSGDLGTENPVVTRLRSGRYVAVFDTIRLGYAIGYADSPDGVHWSKAKQLVLRNSPGFWVDDLRTPLGLIEEPDGTFTLFYTGYDRHKTGPMQKGYGCLGLLQVKVQE